MYCTILCNSVQCTILLYSSSCSSNLKIIQHDPSPSPGNATCNQERGCSRHCGDWSTASVLNQRSTAPESWRLEKCPRKLPEKTGKNCGFPTCRHPNLPNRTAQCQQSPCPLPLYLACDPKSHHHNGRESFLILTSIIEFTITHEQSVAT